MKTVRNPEIAVPKQDIDSHIGQYGLVLVTGGKEDYVGRPALVGIGACRAGCDIVRSTGDGQEGVTWI